MTTPESLRERSSIERLTECTLPLRLRTIAPIPPQILSQLPHTLPTDAQTSILTEKESNFRMISYRGFEDGKDHVAIIKSAGDGKRIPIRVHSSCLTAETFHTSLCDCEEQLNMALSIADEADLGGVIWLNQEGMGNGLPAKLAQIDFEARSGTYEPVTYHGELFIDRREYKIAADILKDLGISSVKLITNNSSKITEMQQLGIEVVSRIPCIVDTPSKWASSYMQSRREKGYLG